MLDIVSCQSLYCTAEKYSDRCKSERVEFQVPEKCPVSYYKLSYEQHSMEKSIKCSYEISNILLFVLFGTFVNTTVNTRSIQIIN